MGAGEGPAAKPGVQLHASRAHLLDLRGQFPVPELPQVVVLLRTAGGLCAKPAEENVTGGLHETLTGDHALALVGVFGFARVTGQGRRLGLFGLQ